MTTAQHTVEKIGGTSMSNYEAVRDNIIIGKRKKSDLYQRIFVVSAYGGVTNELLEHKKTGEPGVDRKSTRLNSSHVRISYAVFCLKKKIVQHVPPSADPAISMPTL